MKKYVVTAVIETKRRNNRANVRRERSAVVCGAKTDVAKARRYR